MSSARVSVIWDEADESWQVTSTSAPGTSVSYPMAAYLDETGTAWPMPHPATRPADGRDTASWDRTGQDFETLARQVRARTPTADEAMAYGRHLFDALLAPGWATLDPPGGAGPLVVELRWAPGPLHGFAWELMHDGTGYLALRATAPVMLVRLAGPDGEDPPATITRPPRVLFAVGCALNDKEVRAGAEIMGVLRELERGTGPSGSAVLARVLISASLSKLADAYERHDPDVVHLIGHGRWDGEAGLGKLTLAREGADPRGAQGAKRQGEEHTAAELFTALSRSPRDPAAPDQRVTPTVVVVSACDSGGVASTAAGLPLGAELAAAGVPIVIAMAGEISDTTCRIFTRSVVASVARGKQLTEALATGRYAAFAYAQGTPEKIDWALPAIFLRAPLPEGFALADTSALGAIREVIEKLGDVAFPLFAGRPELLDDLDDLLQAGNPGALVLHSTYPVPLRIGGTRALQELAAEAVRKGHLPVRIGPFTSGDAPRTFPELADRIAQRLVDIARGKGVPDPRRTLLLLTGHDDPDAPAAAALSVNRLLEMRRVDRSGSTAWLIEELRADVFALRDALAANSPGVFAAGAVPLLLLDDVHLYGEEAVRKLSDQLTADGLGHDVRSLPVALFVKENLSAGQLMLDYRVGHTAQGTVRFRELTHFRMLTDGKDQLALLSWMLNPPRGIPGWQDIVLAPTATDMVGTWFGNFRMTMLKRNFYDQEVYEDYAAEGLERGWLERGEDDKILWTFGMLS